MRVRLIIILLVSSGPFEQYVWIFNSTSFNDTSNVKFFCECFVAQSCYND